MKMHNIICIFSYIKILRLLLVPLTGGDSVVLDRLSSIIAVVVVVVAVVVVALLVFILRRMGKNMGKNIAQVHHTSTHVFSFVSCVDLNQLLSQPNASWCVLRIPLRIAIA